MLFFGGVFWKGWETMVNLTELLAAVTLVILALRRFDLDRFLGRR